ncbi:hypothetical protein TUM3792_05890 [Shewanella sp. MBTL60-007]|nr:hypothetical protein TUM3792_05890 [Shewanella sp. MBTL60-007]
MPTPYVAPPLSGLSSYEGKLLRVHSSLKAEGLNTAYSKRQTFTPMCSLRELRE